MTHKNTRKTKHFWVVSCVLAALLLAAVGSSANSDLPTVGISEPKLFGRCWDYKVIPNLAVMPVIDSSVVYFIDSENRLLALDSATAGRMWSSELGGEVVSNLLLSDPSILLVTNSQVTEGSSTSKTFVRSISQATGVTEWRVEIKPSANVWIGAYPNVIVAVGDGGAISSLSRGEGKVVWERTLGSSVTSSPMFGQKGITLGAENKQVFDVAIADGASRTLWKSKHLPTALFADNSGRLVVGDERGNVTAVAANGERSWTFRNGARISSVLVGDSDYLASSNDNFIYRLTRGGSVKWKRRLPGRVAQAPLLLDDVAVISVTGGGGVFIVEMDNGRILDRILPAEDFSFAIGAATTNSKNFVVAGPSGVSLFSREKCTPK